MWARVYRMGDDSGESGSWYRRWWIDGYQHIRGFGLGAVEEERSSTGDWERMLRKWGWVRRYLWGVGEWFVGLESRFPLAGASRRCFRYTGVLSRPHST